MVQASYDWLVKVNKIQHLSIHKIHLRQIKFICDNPFFCNTLMPKNKRISDIDKQRLFDCHSRGDDYINLAENLGVKRTTAISIVSRMQKRAGVSSLPSGGAIHRKVDDEMRDEMRNILCEYPSLPLKEMNKLLREKLPNKPQITDACLSYQKRELSILK